MSQCGNRHCSQSANVITLNDNWNTGNNICEEWKERAVSQENLSFGFLIISDSNWAVQPQKMARDYKFRTWKVKGFYCLCSERR